MTIQFTRIKNDANGNGRIVCHFLNLMTKKEIALTGKEWIPVSEKYEIALSRARKIGGRKFNNKQFGGGIVFQGSESETEIYINQIVADSGGKEARK